MDDQTIARLKEFFFEAALATYVSGQKAEKVSDPPGRRVFHYRPYQDGQWSDLYYRDTYFVNGQSSCGQTLIYLDGKPVWTMSYHGWCKDDNPEVLAFLKKVLAETYRDGEFCGGRGKYSIEHWKSGDGPFVYENHPALPLPVEEFINFMGHERIMTRTWKPDSSHVVFWHQYQGYLMEP